VVLCHLYVEAERLRHLPCLRWPFSGRQWTSTWNAEVEPAKRARDTETFQSILKSFIRLDLESVSPPDLPENWKPDITILTANGRSD
jgi:hypothetical protein